MKYLGKNEELLNFITDDFSLISSKLFELDMHKKDGELIIDFYFDLLYSKAETKLKLSFEDIEEFSFYYKSDYIFYNVENYKLFKSGSLFYISLDPYNETQEISPNDQDFILSKSIRGYLSE